ncbi:MAG: hypothetical protein IPM88_02125 [Nitrospira sp.]|nr:hypothetical protein [Nitrospira sp.]
MEEAHHGILLPLQERVGDLAQRAHQYASLEHYVTSQIEQKLYAAMNQLPVAEFGAKVVVACPPGEERARHMRHWQSPTVAACVDAGSTT